MSPCLGILEVYHPLVASSAYLLTSAASLAIEAVNGSSDTRINTRGFHQHAIRGVSQQGPIVSLCYGVPKVHYSGILFGYQGSSTPTGLLQGCKKGATVPSCHRTSVYQW